MTKPTVVYVDDEPHNLTVLDSSVDDVYEVHGFTDPIRALEELERLDPSIILSDQRMPQQNGVAFLTLAKKIVPFAKRIIVTGYSEEELVIRSVREAQIFDYIRKPWDTDDLLLRLENAHRTYAMERDKANLIESLEAKTKELEDRAYSLNVAQLELKEIADREAKARVELESWVPPFVLKALESRTGFPITRDLVLLTFDIVGSSRLHQVEFEGKPIRPQILHLFTEAVLRNGGWKESQSGDSAYAHFGLMSGASDPHVSAFSAAREFRVAIRGLAQRSKQEIECGIAIHSAKECLVDVQAVQINTPNGLKVQKTFDTTSQDIDLVHRLESYLHDLPGSNIIVSEEFRAKVDDIGVNCVPLGKVTPKGQSKPTTVHLIPSDKVTDEMIEQFRQRIAKEKSAAPQDAA